ncbi:hypothetical protein [Nonomuraea sp. NPDC049646]|uniref:hypothetical protein n=1 Tax=unclassified Nonomuraea TaxID=2593643 RepID=UPI0037B24A0E
MGRHELNEYEVREVSPAYALAVARRDPPDDPNGKVIVDVDATLRGQEREDAIEVALEPFRRGWRELIPLLLISIAHTPRRTVATAASMSAVAVLGMATLTVSSPIHDQVPPSHAIAIPQAAPALTDPAASHPPTPTQPKPVTGSPVPGPSPVLEPAAEGPTPASDSERQAADDSGDVPAVEHGTAAPHTPTSEGRPPAADTSPTGPPRPTASPTVEAPQPAPKSTTPPAAANPDPTPASAPEPKPTKSSPDVGVKVKAGDKNVADVEVDVDDLEANVGVGDLNIDVDLDDLKVGVGDLKVDLLGRD